MSLPPDLIRRIAQVAHARATSFVALAQLAGLNPARSFRGADLRWVNFATDDLAGYDFTGADLRGAKLRRVRNLNWEMLEGALLDGAELPPPSDFDIVEAQRLIEHGRTPPERWWPFITALPADANAWSRLGKGLRCTTLAPLAGLANLQALNLSGAPIADLVPIAELANLHTLTLSHTQVADIAPLAGLANLHTLSLVNTNVTDLSPLAGLTNLRRLYVDDTQVVDLTPIGGLANLHTLTLNVTQVADLAPIARLSALQVHITGMEVRPADLARRGKACVSQKSDGALRRASV